MLCVCVAKKKNKNIFAVARLHWRGWLHLPWMHLFSISFPLNKKYDRAIPRTVLTIHVQCLYSVRCAYSWYCSHFTCFELNYYILCWPSHNEWSENDRLFVKLAPVGSSNLIFVQCNGYRRKKHRIKYAFGFACIYWISY